MTALFIILDILVYTFSPYQFHLVVLSIPFAKSFFPIGIYFLILAFYEPKYLINLFLLYIIFWINNILSRQVRNTWIVCFFKLIVFYAFYVLSLRFFDFVF